VAERNLFLIGPMGAGKSAVGKQLARLLHRQFLDTDSEIERRTGVDIPLIFEKEGEAGFRKREKAVIDELTRHRAVVVATGGGAVLDPDTRAALASRGTVVYLHASVGQQMERTRHSRNRPLLHTDDPASRLREIMGVREPLYRELADYEVDTDGRKVGDVAREIWRLYRDDSNGDT
jgi:shikimate kinase